MKMKSNPVLHAVFLCCFVAACLTSTNPAVAQSSSDWIMVLYVKGGSIGSSFGVCPWGQDGYDGTRGLYINPSLSTIDLLLYREHGPDWPGPTAFYGGEIWKSPIPDGGSRTWSGFYLWAQNRTPSPANLIVIEPESEFNLPPPAGYRGHLVLDYVPDSCNWQGDRDFWLDLTADNEFALPIPVVADPLLGTRFHIDVYAVPEPSSLVALVCGLAGVGGVVIRRRKHST